MSRMFQTLSRCTLDDYLSLAGFVGMLGVLILGMAI